jgi:integrase
LGTADGKLQPANAMSSRRLRASPVPGLHRVRKEYHFLDREFVPFVTPKLPAAQHVRRAKSGDASVHPISARESRALRKLLREAPTSPYVFISERRAPLSAAGYQRMVARAGVAAKVTFLVHSHMLRHACGFKLANDGHDTRAIQAYLGHRSIMSTVRYTALTPNRFKNFWKD